MDRRQAIAVLGAAGLAAAAYRVWGGGGMTARGAVWPRGRTPAVTPTANHYRVSKSALWPDPRIDVERWRLDVHGQVPRPLSLSLADLRSMPLVAQHATLACVGNSVPARAIGTALWTGVPLAAVLERAGVSRDRAQSGRPADLVFTGADNYTDSIPLDRALHPGALLAYEMNGEPVPRAHGAPLRAIVPGIYGMKNVKWIEAIEMVPGDYLGYWQQRGWSDAAPYRTLSRIDEPRRGDELAAGATHAISGIAFAGDRGIARVEVEVAGHFMAPAALESPLSPYTWVLWWLTWTPPGPGAYTIRARAVDGEGTPQIAEPHPSFPDGATGLHTVEVAVR